MPTSTFTVRVDRALKNRLEKLVKSTGRSRSFLAAEAIGDFVEANEWQIAGIKQATASLDGEEGVAHHEVDAWVRSWTTPKERTIPRRRRS